MPLVTRNLGINYKLSRTACSVSEALPYLQANNLAYNSFMVARRGQETSGSETKGILLQQLQLLENQHLLW